MVIFGRKNHVTKASFCQLGRWNFPSHETPHSTTPIPPLPPSPPSWLVHTVWPWLNPPGNDIIGMSSPAANWAAYTSSASLHFHAKLRHHLGFHPLPPGLKFSCGFSQKQIHSFHLKWHSQDCGFITIINH